MKRFLAAVLALAIMVPSVGLAFASSSQQQGAEQAPTDGPRPRGLQGRVKTDTPPIVRSAEGSFILTIRRGDATHDVTVNVTGDTRWGVQGQDRDATIPAAVVLKAGTEVRILGRAVGDSRPPTQVTARAVIVQRARVAGTVVSFSAPTGTTNGTLVVTTRQGSTRSVTVTSGTRVRPEGTIPTPGAQVVVVGRYNLGDGSTTAGGIGVRPAR